MKPYSSVPVKSLTGTFVYNEYFFSIAIIRAYYKIWAFFIPVIDYNRLNPVGLTDSLFN